MQTSLYDATYGRSGGGNIQAITKSGSNDYHGALYEFFRNDALNANNPFLKAAGVGRPELKRNIFGGAIGGPIRKDKLFFFGSYQGTRERNAASVINSLSSNILIAPGLTADRSQQAALLPSLSRLQPVAGRSAGHQSDRARIVERQTPERQLSDPHSAGQRPLFRRDTIHL